jgi:hypothetical protein
MTVRACIRHGCTLLDDDDDCPCPAGHFVTEWLVVQNGHVVAEVRGKAVRWFESGTMDDVMVPDPDVSRRRLWSIYSACDLRRRSDKRRERERKAAKREGREPAEWACKRNGPQFEEHDDSFMRGSQYKAQRMRADETEL